MSEQTRYRITGGLFLLAIAIIFVPMLFDDDGVPSVELAPVDADYQPPVVEAFEDVVPETDLAARVQALREEADDQGFHRTTGTRIGEPVLSLPNDETGAWAIQLGSFSEADKATAFRDRLRADGHEAFTSMFKRREGTIMHRVAVGPFLSEERASSLAADLSDQYGETPKLMAFGN